MRTIESSQACASDDVLVCENNFVSFDANLWRLHDGLAGSNSYNWSCVKTGRVRLGPTLIFSCSGAKRGARSALDVTRGHIYDLKPK